MGCPQGTSKASGPGQNKGNHVSSGSAWVCRCTRSGFEFGSGLMCCMLAMQDFTRVWRGLESIDCQRMSLVWETEELLALNKSIVSFLKDQVDCSPLHSH